MRIAYLAQSYAPMISGASIVVESLAKAMAARAHEVVLIATSDRGQTYRMQEGNLAIVRLRSLHNPRQPHTSRVYKPFYTAARVGASPLTMTSARRFQISRICLEAAG